MWVPRVRQFILKSALVLQKEICHGQHSIVVVQISRMKESKHVDHAQKFKQVQRHDTNCSRSCYYYCKHPLFLPSLPSMFCVISLHYNHCQYTRQIPCQILSITYAGCFHCCISQNRLNAQRIDKHVYVKIAQLYSKASYDVNIESQLGRIIAMEMKCYVLHYVHA